MIPLLEQQGWLADRALIYLERENEGTAPLIPANWQLLKTNRLVRCVTSCICGRVQHHEMVILLLAKLIVMGFWLGSVYFTFLHPLEGKIPR